MITQFDIQADERKESITISNEEKMIPLSSPYTIRTEEVPDPLAGVTISGISPALKQGETNAELFVQGSYTGVTEAQYLIVIESDGAVGSATFYWSDDNGETIKGSNILTDTSPIPLNNGIAISFEEGEDLNAGDSWKFIASGFSYVSSLPAAPYEFYVDYLTGDITFYPDQAGWQIKINYEGKGTLVDADDINQITYAINALEALRSQTINLDILSAILPDSDAPDRLIEMADTFYYAYLLFNPDKNESVFFQLIAPSRIEEAISLNIIWITEATTGKSIFSASIKVIRQGEIIGNQTESNFISEPTEANPTANSINLSSITISSLNIKDGDLLFIKLTRNGQDGQDTITDDIKVLAIYLKFLQSPKD